MDHQYRYTIPLLELHVILMYSQIPKILPNNYTYPNFGALDIINVIDQTYASHM